MRAKSILIGGGVLFLLLFAFASCLPKPQSKPTTSRKYVESNSIWLMCGAFPIYLDKQKEKFSLTHDGKIYQGRATINPTQIDFEANVFYKSHNARMFYEFSINRKTLEYEMRLGTVTPGEYLPYNRITLPDKTEYTYDEEGKCEIVEKPPTQDNKI